MRSENGTFPAVHAPPTDACRARRALPLPMHAARTPGAFHFEPLLRGGARPKYGDSIITARLSRRPKQATAHSPHLARIISLPQRCRCGVRRGLFLFPAPVLSCLRRPPMFGSTTPSTPLSPPAGRRPAAVRAKAPARTAHWRPRLAPCPGRGRAETCRAGDARDRPRLITA